MKIKMKFSNPKGAENTVLTLFSKCGVAFHLWQNLTATYDTVSSLYLSNLVRLVRLLPAKLLYTYFKKDRA